MGSAFLDTDGSHVPQIADENMTNGKEVPAVLACAGFVFATGQSQFRFVLLSRITRILS